MKLSGLFDAKSIFIKEHQVYYLRKSWEDIGIHTLRKSICPNVNIITWLEFEIVDYSIAVQYINHYAISTPSHEILLIISMRYYLKDNYLNLNYMKCCFDDNKSDIINASYKLTSLN